MFVINSKKILLIFKKHKKLFYFVAFVFFTCFEIFSQNNKDYLIVGIKPGDGITILLQRYNLQINEFNIRKFKELNKQKIRSNDELILEKKYLLPIKIFDFNSISIQTSIEGINDDIAQKIKIYNNSLLQSGLIGKSYKSSGKIYVPLVYLENQSISTEIRDGKDEISEYPLFYELSGKSANFKIFGEKYSKVTKKSSVLKGLIFYLVSGHGGPDPGAIGFKDGFELHEDEYAYDVTLRLGKNIIENGGKVFFLIIDKNDGIRDDKFLNTSSKETFSTGDTISILQKERLAKGTEIINDLFNKNKNVSKNQISINIHLDSRENKQKIDIFFYHQDNDKSGEFIANTLLNTIKNKYDKNQPGRGYKGTVSTRNLFMLKNTIPTTIYIELGNIQNERDQIRFIEYNNRQAIANWLFDGLKKAFSNQ